MPFRTNCTHCSRSYRLADELRGRQVRCQGCGGVFDATLADDPPPDAIRAGAPQASLEPAPKTSARKRREPGRPAPANRFGIASLIVGVLAGILGWFVADWAIGKIFRPQPMPVFDVDRPPFDVPPPPDAKQP